MEAQRIMEEIEYNLPSTTNAIPSPENTVCCRSIFASAKRSNSDSKLAAIKSFTWRQNVTLVSLALMDFMNFCSFSMMAPFFPKEASKKGLSDILSGLIFSSYPLMLLVSSPVFGKILPKFGAKALFLFGVSVAGVCSILFGLLENIQNFTLFATLCVIIRGMQAVACNAFSSASYVLVVNSFPDNTESVLGILENFVSFGMSTGPVLGGILYSLGGFSMPFSILGSTMIVLVPLNVFILVDAEDCELAKRTSSMFRLLRVPSMVVTGIVVVVIASTWSFLNPTLEPHLRRFNLSPWIVGLAFLLISGLYGIFSPAWQMLAEKVNYHWSMMVIGLFMCTVGLLLLGPCPLLPFDHSGLWLDLTALSILGISLALALISTFVEMITSASKVQSEDHLSVHSFVIGMWTSMHFFGEAFGPTLGGLLLHYCGFPLASTVMAIVTLSVAVIALAFFSFRKTNSVASVISTSVSDLTDLWSSSSLEEFDEHMPLLTPADGSSSRSNAEYRRFPIIRKSTEDKRMRLLKRPIVASSNR